MIDSREIAHRLVDAFNAHDEQRLLKLNTSDSVFHAPGDVEAHGADGSTEYTMSWLNAFPNAKITVHHEITEDDWVAQRFTFEGDHTAPLAAPTGTIPPTGRHLAGRGLQLLRIQGDQVAETHLYFDQVQVLTQLGLMPEPAHA